MTEIRFQDFLLAKSCAMPKIITMRNPHHNKNTEGNEFVGKKIIRSAETLYTLFLSRD